MNKHEKEFIKWLTRTEPKLARAALEKMEREAMMNGLGEDTTKAGFFTGFTSFVKDLLPVAVQEKQRRDAVKVAMEQARNSQPIINTTTGYSIPEPVKWAGLGLAGVAGVVLLKSLFTKKR